MRIFNPGFAAIAALAAIVIALVLPSAFAQDSPKPGDDFIRLLDAKQYAESWDIASDYFKQSVSRNDWATFSSTSGGTESSLSRAGRPSKTGTRTVSSSHAN